MTTTQIAQLHYDAAADRLTWGENPLDRLSCGTCFEALLVDEDGRPYWEQTRLEYSHGKGGWYLVGLPHVQASGVWARM